MIPSDEVLQFWRQLANSPVAMRSSIDEYRPAEFVQLLDAVDSLKKQNEVLLSAVHAAARCMPCVSELHFEVRCELNAAIRFYRDNQ